MDATPRVFLDESAHYLRAVYGPRLVRAFEILPRADLWWRPHPDAIAFGTILLHLEGNIRQWILSGLGGLHDARDRASEFAATGGADGQTLLDRLLATMTAAADVIAKTDLGDLGEKRVVQRMETTTLGAILHVVEHCSWHTGQAVWIAKARAGAKHGLAFYDDAVVNDAHND